MLCLCTLITPATAQQRNPAKEAKSPKTPVKKDFTPYIPEIFAGNDQHSGFKDYEFSQRQLDYIASRSFDQKKFTNYLKKKWSIEKLTEYTKKTPHSRLPNKVGYNAAKFIDVDVYKGTKHRFDSLQVTVYDQYGHLITPEQRYSSNKDGTIDEIKRWAWSLSIEKGRKSWSIQSELPNQRFDKKIKTKDKVDVNK